MDKIISVLWIILVVIFVGWVLWIIYDYFFRAKTTIEPADPQELLDSEFTKRDDGLNELVSFICMNFSVNEQELKTKTYQSDLDSMIVKLSFSNIDCVVISNWAKYTHEIQLTCFDDTTITALKITDHRSKVFKMNKQTFLADYVRIEKFLSEFKQTINVQTSVNDILQDIASIARAPELEELSDIRKNVTLYQAAQQMANLLYDKKFRSNEEFICAYTQLMIYICSSGKRDEMVKYLKNELEEEQEEV